MLGRNIYQAACGTASDAVSFIENLRINLNSLSSDVSFHVLNGMLFEIYFDSEGNFRNNFKASMIDYIFQLEELDQFCESFSFIKQALGPYLKNLFYIPLTSKGVSIDISCIEYEQDTKAIDGIFFEGDNVLFNELGDNYFDPKTDFSLKKISKKEIIDTLHINLAIPSWQLTVNFINLKEDITELLVPYNMNIKRLAD